MTKLNLMVVFLCICVLYHSESLLAQDKSTISAIPRVDVHSHVGSVERMEHYIKVSQALKEQYGINLAAWIDLNFMRQSGETEHEYLDAAANRYQGRFLPCINDFKISDGLRYPPEELIKWQKKGIVGYKIWVGVSPLIDRPANDVTFSRMEEIGMVGASVHISQPYPTSWCEDPVKFWEAQNAWERVLDRHPKLKVVNAHMLDHFNSDEQLDYLMYILETYPNIHVDLGARFQQFHRMDRDKLRNFMIKYADRILFGTDIGGQPAGGKYRQVAESYYRAFQLLETDRVVKGGFFGSTETRGLALPADVLEKIYYQNAAELYPRVKDTLKNMGLLPTTILSENVAVTLENVVSPGPNLADEP
jgi:predicted TIM-barrel fold metal-dependent hydrolase